MATDLDLDAKLEHHFKGDTELLAKTASARAEVRKALATLQQEVQKYSASSCQIQADIKFNVLGPIAKEHLYSVNITDRKFDQDLFARTKTLAGKPAAKGTAGSPGAPAPRASHDDDEVVEVRPFKRLRTDESNGQPSPRSRGLGSFSADITATERIEGTHKLMQTWHNEWTSQGGWLFDTLTKAAATSTTNHTALLTKLDVHCRKTNADKVQSREEKWRSSSATFHDQNRRERETAEKRIEEKLEKQRELLVKIAEANGVDVEDDDEEDKRSEVSLGAQLTAELNLEASRAARDGTDSRKNSSITIDD
ncbi:uncharacterized protein MYCGRDRAFT_111263 [Zymoseptoria tritici IPO323]|uniref:Uncharacterized protein n=1 Tax=Zymoseptoria tritici (strain CBS 115943 / IPO323) TaxID=336722 RepID=F9XN34_ZYMTI|nr:uncharacterized protein MYCGRDRAFT_111263 [Zymoseptoria tritici IPO323]EGP83584.1 hypothetical protein MYCGRDRAFT_111263 [Zymoseptoria tritici IPO323]